MQYLLIKYLWLKKMIYVCVQIFYNLIIRYLFNTFQS